MIVEELLYHNLAKESNYNNFRLSFLLMPISPCAFNSFMGSYLSFFPLSTVRHFLENCLCKGYSNKLMFLHFLITKFYVVGEAKLSDRIEYCN